jgi:excisionase family DNA binding protein
MPGEEQEPLTVEDVARQLKVTVETVRAWIRTGELNAIDVGRYLIYPADLEDFKRRRSTRKQRKDEG